MVCFSTHDDENSLLGGLLERRDFFKFGFIKGREIAADVFEVGLKIKFKREMIRPPGALPEDQFLLACTRCGECQKACPHDAIHLVSQLSSGVLLNTPFIDPYHKACQYCSDMPCISSCEPKALKMNSEEKLPIMAQAQVNEKHCLVSQGQYCDYCRNSCPDDINALVIRDREIPKIDLEKCVGCGKCAYICVSQTGRAIEMIPI